MNIDMMYLCVTLADSLKVPYCIVGQTITVVTLIICGTILWISWLKTKSQGRLHNAKLKDACDIKVMCCCNHCKSKDCSNIVCAKSKGEDPK